MQYRASETDKIPDMDYLIDWLPKNIPREAPYERTTIVHGDYRLDNVVFHPTEMKIIAVLDWELSTLGNPLSDLSSFGCNYHMPVIGFHL
jgi:aminoglycoside phosphotransferase (APT) family kinase protein